MNRLVFILACLAICSHSSARAVSISTVPVGNAGNAGQPQAQGTFGGVAYDFRIGRTEVTNAQYTEFLNAKAKTDPLFLFSTDMDGLFGGIRRSGTDGSYTYESYLGRENMPVNYVTWHDAIRFANWLHNGQGDGDTESGAYTLLGGTITPSNSHSITRNPGATWFLPSEDEWYKAAYHKNDGVTGNYFQYATGSDVAPTSEVPPGGNNSANYGFAVEDVSTVGAYTGTRSPYDAYDMAGNVWEWTEVLINGNQRGLRGGSLTNHDSSVLLSSFRNSDAPSAPEYWAGFRLATTVPEPSSWILGATAGLGGYAMTRLRRRS